MVAFLGTEPSIHTSQTATSSSTMTNSNEEGVHMPIESDDSIKAAVRDAARKTQERLAAYQKKQAAKAALEEQLQQQQQAKTPSKDKLQAESTVSRLQALVSESKRLTNKSRELNTAPSVQAAAIAQDMAIPSTPRELTAMSLRATEDSALSSSRSSSRATPKGKKLSELFQSLGGSHSNLSHTMPPGRSRSGSASVSGEKSPTMTRSASMSKMSETPNKTNTGMKLSALFQSLNHPNFDQEDTDEERSNASSDVIGALRNSCGLEREQSVQDLAPVLKDAISQNSLSKIKHGRKDHHASLPTLKVDDMGDDSGVGNNKSDEDDNQGGQDCGDDDSNSSGEYSILSLVENKKQPASAGIGDLTQDEIDDMIQEYYSTPAEEALKVADPYMDASLPTLEDILETPKPMNPKPKVTGSTKKKRKHPRRPSSKGEKSDQEKSSKEDLNGSMPVLAPFETPKGGKPKLMSSSELLGTKQCDDPVDNNDILLTQEEAEASLNFSELVMRPIHALAEPRSHEEKNNNNNSDSSGASHKSGLRRPSVGHNASSNEVDQVSRRGQNLPLNLSKLTLIGDNPSSVRRSTSAGGSEDDDDKSTSSAASSSSSVRGSRHRQSTRRGRDKEEDARSARSRSRSSRSKSVNGRKNASRRPSLNSAMSDRSKKSEGTNVSLSIINKYHKKAEESLQSFPDEVSVGDQSNTEKMTTTDKNKNASKTELDVSELSRSSDGKDEIGPGMGDGSDALSESSNSRQGSARRGRDRNDSSIKDRSRSRSAVRRAASSRSASRSVSAVRGGRRTGRRASIGGKPESTSDGSMRDTSALGESMQDTSSRASSARRSRAREGNGSVRDLSTNDAAGNRSMKDMSTRDRSTRDIGARASSVRRSRTREGNGSMRDMSASEAVRQRRSISTRRGAGRRGLQRKAENPDEGDSQADTADEILGSLDVSDIKIVGVDDEEFDSSSTFDPNSSRSSIYDRKQKRPSVKAGSNSLAGLSKVQAGEGHEDGEGSVSESVATKKSLMGKFARKVGRTLTRKKKKKKNDSKADDGEADDDDDEGEEVTETDMDMELRALAAEYDEEEKDIDNNSSFESSFSRSDFGQENPAAEEPEVKKSKKKRASIMLSKIKKVGSKIAGKKKKKKKDSKGSEVLGSDSDSDDDELRGSEYSGGTLDRSHSDSLEDHDDDGQTDEFAQLKIDGDAASIAMCGSDRSDSHSMPHSKGRQRRATGASMKRISIADRQRSQSLQVVLSANRGDNAAKGDEGSVMTSDTKFRARRAQSLRGRAGQGDGAKVNGVVTRHKSLKGRIEGEAGFKGDKSKRLRRSKSGDPERFDEEEETPPPFNWEAYSAEKETLHTKKGKEKKKVPTVKKMNGGLSKVIYCGQTVTS